MPFGALWFLVGVVAVQQLASLPGLAWCVAPFILVPIAIHWPLLRGPAWCCAGFAWALWRAHLALSGGDLSTELIGVDVVVEGTVATLPSRTETDTRFVVESAEIIRDGQRTAAPGDIRLSWRNPEADLRVGERWRLLARLKPPHGFMNPGGFDYEGWLYQQGIRATGYVRMPREHDAEIGTSTEVPKVNIRLEPSSAMYLLGRWRQHLADRIDTVLRDTSHAPVVAALSLGTTRDFSPQRWEVLNRTGTTHLISVSGLHIGFIAGAAFFLMRRLWAYAARAPLYWPAPKAAAMVALVAATVYAALAGFSVPTQRSLVMVAVVMGMILAQRQARPSEILALSLLAVLLLDPLAVLQPGFWLSFGAVAVILFATTGRWGEGGWWWKWGRVQWVIAVGMVPLMLMLFARTSVIAPVANFIAVPWFNFITVPLSLLGTLLADVLSPLGVPLLYLAQWSVEPMWWLLEQLAAIPWSLWTQHLPPLWTVWVASLGTLILLLPRGIPARGVGLVLLAPVFLVKPDAPAPGEFLLTLLDVGQGLATVVRTREHTLVFDTGPQFSERFDTGDAVVVPYLREQGVGRIDLLLLSHPDGDHVGGARSVLDAMPVDAVMSSAGVDGIARTHACVAGSEWVWDGVTFRVLYPSESGPPPRPRSRDNDASCVVSVATGAQRALLTGDIEARSERWLIDNAAPQIRADVLIVPHHGSATSSTEEFVAAVAPRVVLFPVGYRNRFRFPKPEVVERYRARGVQLLDTAASGAITLRFSGVGISAPEQARESGRRYWHHAP